MVTLVNSQQKIAEIHGQEHLQTIEQMQVVSKISDEQLFKLAQISVHVRVIDEAVGLLAGLAHMVTFCSASLTTPNIAVAITATIIWGRFGKGGLWKHMYNGFLIFSFGKYRRPAPAALPN